jgi:hypothetical protein
MVRPRQPQLTGFCHAGSAIRVGLELESCAMHTGVQSGLEATCAAMAKEPAYQTEVQTITAAFVQADWEVLRLATGAIP